LDITERAASGFGSTGTPTKSTDRRD